MNENSFLLKDSTKSIVRRTSASPRRRTIFAGSSFVSIQNIVRDMTTFESTDESEYAAVATDTTTTNARRRLDEDLQCLEVQITEDITPSSSEKLGVISMAVLVFYNVSGGPFGIETTVRAGGNFYAILGFLVMPFVWSVQEALMTAELGTAFVEASGGVAWVEEAFGPSVGWMSGYLGWTSGATGTVYDMEQKKKSSLV